MEFKEIYKGTIQVEIPVVDKSWLLEIVKVQWICQKRITIYRSAEIYIKFKKE